MKGFKSFAEPTVLEFQPGVTVVVGPNGSGKSNVVDAVAWVLGAQGPRTVRSAKMEDVIFAGTPKKAALGRAEVTLTIDNSAGLLPIEFNEVSITRTLFRSGESEYAINRAPCRLVDVHDLLSDAGVGRSQHVIVSQGNLDAVLDARPEERRQVVEEAAGILKYRRRRERSQRRLESTEASLVRLQDLLREVRRQLRPLERQAEAARRHGELSEELAALKRFLLGCDTTAARAVLERVAHSSQGLRAEQEALSAQLSTLDDALSQAEAEQRALGDVEDSDLAELLSEAEALRARAQGMTELAQERLERFRQAAALEATRDLVLALEAEAASLRGQLDQTEAEAATLLPEAEELARAEADLERRQVELDAQAPAGSQAHERAGGLAGLEAELASLTSSLQRAAEERRRLEQRLEVLDARSAGLAQETHQALEELARAQSAGESATTELGLAEQSLEQASTALEAAEEAWRRSEADRNRLESRRDTLAAAMDRARAQSAWDALEGAAGLVGLVVELVGLEPGLEAAFEAAAGDLVRAVLVEGTAAAKEALERLRRAGRLGAVAPVGGESLGLEAAGRLPAASAGTGRPLLDVVTGAHPALVPLLRAHLANAVVVDGLDEAAELAGRRPDLVVVTPGGDRLGANVWRTGGDSGGANAHTLRQAEQEAQQAALTAGAAEAELNRARSERDEAFRAVGELRSRLSEAQASGASAQRLLDRLAVESTEVRAEVARLTAQLEELEARTSLDRLKADELASALPEARRLAQAAQQKEESLRQARHQLGCEQSAVAARRRRLELRAASLEERRLLSRRRLSEIERSLAEASEQAQETVRARLHAKRAALVAESLLEAVEREAGSLELAVESLRHQRQAVLEARRMGAARLEAMRRERAGAERSLAQVRERLNRLELERTEARVRLESLAETARRELDCELSEVVSAPCPPLPPGSSPASRRAELERELRLLGPVNPLALDEHQALSERAEFLEGQLEDVLRARRELTKLIRAIDEEMSEMFVAAFSDVADHFSRLFASLFPGGEGRIYLSDPAAPLESGIEVEARPSGKSLRRLSLLSGGERSLVALALLFAVFRARPSPFYLLDEVEAALDDANLSRFLSLVDQFRRDSQLLIVSHQKRTMETADCLYGVSMSESGCSKVVSQSLSAVQGQP